MNLISERRAWNAPPAARRGAQPPAPPSRARPHHALGGSFKGQRCIHRDFANFAAAPVRRGAPCILCIARCNASAAGRAMPSGPVPVPQRCVQGWYALNSPSLELPRHVRGAALFSTPRTSTCRPAAPLSRARRSPPLSPANGVVSASARAQARQRPGLANAAFLEAHTAQGRDLIHYAPFPCACAPTRDQHREQVHATTW